MFPRMKDTQLGISLVLFQEGFATHLQVRQRVESPAVKLAQICLTREALWPGYITCSGTYSL